MDENSLAGFLRMAGGPDQQPQQQPDMQQALQHLMTPDPQIEAMMGPQRQQQGYPSLAQTLGRMGQQYQGMPNGPMGVDPMGQTPTINPFAQRPPAPLQMPTRGFR